MCGEKARGGSHRAAVGCIAVVALAFCVAISMLPAFPNERVPARRTMCMSNLKQIVNACRLHAHDNADAFPPDLAALFPEYASDSRLFVCPIAAREGHVIDSGTGDILVPDAVCYAYVSGLRATDDSEFVIAFDEEWNHAREGMIFACVGGAVAWAGDIERFHAGLDRQRALLAAKGRTIRVIRPTWSRWPDAPEYFVRAQFRRTLLTVLGVVAAIALAGGVTVLIIRRRRAVSVASAEGSGDSLSDGC